MGEQAIPEKIWVKHKFLCHEIDLGTEILIVGTFNPGVSDNAANFFYGGEKNQLWSLLPAIYGESDLKKSSKEEKIRFAKGKNIDFIDLISEVRVDQGKELSREDKYIGKQEIKWRDVIGELEKLPKLKRACFTRRSFSDAKIIKIRVDQIETYCRGHHICFQCLVTPSPVYRGMTFAQKQNEWAAFFNPKGGADEQRCCY